MLIRWKYYCFWNCYSNFCCKCIVKKFVIRTPPKWIIDYSCSGYCSVLQHRTIKRNILRNSVDQHIITKWFALNNFVYMSEFSSNSIFFFAVNSINKSLWKSIFLSKKNSDFFHFYSDLKLVF